MPIFFVEKMWEAFAVQKPFLIFSTKNISVFGNKVVKHLTSWPLNELVKLTMLWTTGPITANNADPVALRRSAASKLILHSLSMLPKQAFFVWKKGKYTYSRLSLSRNRRDPQKQIEISVLRHIRFVVLRKNQFEQPKDHVHKGPKMAPNQTDSYCYE